MRTADALISVSLDLVFQPIINIQSGTTIGFEALARWHSPIIGPISPTHFIPIAERTGMVQKITHVLLNKALKYASYWPQDIRLSFNLSAHDIGSPESVLAVITMITTSGFDAKRIDLEITETALICDFHLADRAAQAFRALGCGISLDDFGTGFSSISHLYTLPITRIKIDKSFIRGVHENSSSYKIVKSLVALGRDMGLDCVIEGVETLDELDKLRSLGALLMQGYLYSKPIGATEVSSFLKKQSTRLWE